MPDTKRALGIVITLFAALTVPAREAQATPRRRAKATSTEARRRSSDAVAKKSEPRPKHSESIGSPNDGKLEGGVHLETRPYLHVVPTYASGDVRWGLPELVDMIDRSARLVAKRFPGSALDVGDLSKKGGGDVLRHHSHESGRDADLGFYALDSKGKQVHAHVFVKFETGALESTNVKGARFDLARNWALVESLTADPRARVSHIFVSEPLKQQLIAWAKSHAISRRAIDRVEMVMMQPHHSLPHDDHFHVRISCPPSSHECIELAKGALTSRPRIARRLGPHFAHKPDALKTPPPKPLAAPALDDTETVDAPDDDEDASDTR